MSQAWTLFDALDVDGDHTISLEDGVAVSLVASTVLDKSCKLWNLDRLAFASVIDSKYLEITQCTTSRTLHLHTPSNLYELMQHM